MGFITPELPDVDRDTWQTAPRTLQLQVVTQHWVEHSFGTPYAVYSSLCCDHLAYPGPGRSGSHRRLVDTANPVPGSYRLHLAVRGFRSRLRIQLADRSVRSIDRWLSL